MSTKIQYASDLHLEFEANKQFIKKHPIKPSAEILVLAGDIVPFNQTDRHADFFSYLSDHFETTYWLPGNHEYYHFDAEQKTGNVYENIRKNIVLVNNVSVDLQSIRLVFTTLWSHIRTENQWYIENALNDFRMIKYNGFRFSVERYNQLHADAIEFLNKMTLSSSNENTVVFTHHCPTFLNYPPQYKGDTLSDAFATELLNFIENTSPACWIYGHHHSNIPEFKIGTTRMLTNQLGYVQLNEHSRFRLDACIAF